MVSAIWFSLGFCTVLCVCFQTNLTSANCNPFPNHEEFLLEDVTGSSGQLLYHCSQPLLWVATSTRSLFLSFDSYTAGGGKLTQLPEATQEIYWKYVIFWPCSTAKPGCTGQHKRMEIHMGHFSHSTAHAAYGKKYIYSTGNRHRIEGLSLSYCHSATRTGVGNIEIPASVTSRWASPHSARKSA